VSANKFDLRLKGLFLAAFVRRSAAWKGFLPNIHGKIISNYRLRARLDLVVANVLTSFLLSATLASSAFAKDPPAISVTCKGELPFAEADLLEAMRLRLPLMRLGQPAGKLPPVTVSAIAPDQASVAVGRSSRRISLEGLEGADAARIVALLSLDMISNPQNVSISLQAPDGEPRREKSATVFVEVSTRIGLGVSESPTFEPTLDLSIKVSRNFLVFVEGGVTWAAAGEGADELRLTEIPIRAGAGIRFDWFEVRAGIALRPYFVSGVGEDEGVLVGGALELRLRRDLTPWLTGHVVAGVDVFPLRKAFDVGGNAALTTSWATPWIGLGAGWQR